MDKMELLRDSEGKLISHVWPGGYPVYYVTKDGMAVCPDCANREVDQAQEVVAYDVNWEDGHLYCEDCGKRIESAYAEDESDEGDD